MNEIPLKQDEGKQKSTTMRLVYDVIIVLACIYVFFLLYQSVYYNWQMNQKIRNLKSNIAKLNNDQTQLQSLNSYYKTWAFQELEAREKLGFKMSGEKAIQVKVEETATPTPVNRDKNSPNEVQKPNFQKWLDYISGKQA